MNRRIGYYIAKIYGTIKRDKHKETLNKWFEKQGITLKKMKKMIG